MIERRFAETFAREWIAAWNAHDLDRVLSHYRDDFDFASPFIVTAIGEASGRLKGKAAVEAYWRRGLELLPDLHFELERVLTGIDTVTLCYRSPRGPAVEVFRFGRDGRVCCACAHYE